MNYASDLHFQRMREYLDKAEDMGSIEMRMFYLFLAIDRYFLAIGD